MSKGAPSLLPPPIESDPEDVAWALSTAEALWKRGEYVDAVAWIRKAATAAGEADADMRVVQLAKAAAELQALVDTFGPPAEAAAEPAGDRVSDGGAIDIDVDVAAEEVIVGDPAPLPSAIFAPPAAEPPKPPPRPPGPPPRRPDPPRRLPTPNPVPSPLASVPFEEIASAAAIDEPLPPPPRTEPPPASADLDSMQSIPSVPPPPPDFAPTPMAMPVAKSVPPPAEPPPPKPAIASESPRGRATRSSTAPFGVPAPDGTPSLAEAAIGLRPVRRERLELDEELVPAIEVPPKPGRPSPLPPAVSRASTSRTASVPPPPAAPRSERVPAAPTPPLGSVPPVIPRPPKEAPRFALTPSSLPSAVDEEGLQSQISDAPPRVAQSNVQIPGPPKAPALGTRVATLSGFPSQPPPATPALTNAPISGRAVLLDPEQFEVLADVPDDAREALVQQAERVVLLPDETAPAPAMIIVLHGEVEVRARGFVTRLDVASQGQVRLLAPFSPAQGDLELVGGAKGARFLALGPKAVEVLNGAAPWVVQELEPASDDVHVVAGALRGRHGSKLDGGILDAILVRAKTMRLGPGAKVVKSGENVRALILVGAGDLTMRGGDAQDAPVVSRLAPGDVLYAAELLGRLPAPHTVRAGDSGALVIVATRAATEELLVTVPPLLELLAEQ